MKRSRKNRFSTRTRSQKSAVFRSAAQETPMNMRFFSTVGQGLLDGFAAPFVFLLGSDLSLERRPVSGVAEAWQDVGSYIRKSAEEYKKQQDKDISSESARC